MKIYYNSLFSIIFLFGFDKTCAQNVYVNTTRGQIFGYHVDYGSNTSALYYGQADVFVGIPYVKPPVGSLRFQVSISNHTCTRGRGAAPPQFVVSSDRFVFDQLSPSPLLVHVCI